MGWYYHEDGGAARAVRNDGIDGAVSGGYEGFAQERREEGEMTSRDELAARAKLEVGYLMSACIGVMLDGGKPAESEWVADAKAKLLATIETLGAA